VAGKLPLVLVEQVDPARAPANVKLIAAFGTNPDPRAATSTPIPPLIGSIDMLEFTANDAVAEPVPAEACMVAGPYGAAGTVSVQTVPLAPGKVPLESVEQIDAAGTPPKVNVTVELATNPVPSVVTVEPTTPLVGERARCAVGGWTANRAASEWPGGCPVPALPAAIRQDKTRMTSTAADSRPFRIRPLLRRRRVSGLTRPRAAVLDRIARRDDSTGPASA
jgi:hypothetical protein